MRVPSTAARTGPGAGAQRDDQGGLTGLQELAVAVGVAALLSVGGLFTYRVLVSGANDRQVQASLVTVLSAAHDVYADTQDFGLIATDHPDPGGAAACGTGTPSFSLLASYAVGVAVGCSPQTRYQAGTVVYASGELVDGDAGGWIGLGALASDGVCWQVYLPADGPAVYGARAAVPCGAPAGPPPGGGASW